MGKGIEGNEKKLKKFYHFVDINKVIGNRFSGILARLGFDSDTRVCGIFRYYSACY